MNVGALVQGVGRRVELNWTGLGDCGSDVVRLAKRVVLKLPSSVNHMLS